MTDVNELFKNGMTPELTAFASDVYLCEFFVDQLEEANIRIESYCRKNGLLIHSNKQAINRAKHVIKQMTDKQRNILGSDDIASDFGINSHLIFQILQKMVFLPMATKEQLLT
jgi:hypothetical protein